MAFKLAIPKDSLILVTGSNGHVGSHVADQLLSEGYKVRAPVRSLEKSSFLQKRFDAKYGVGRFELTLVQNFAKQGAYDEAIKGVSGVVHIANTFFTSSEWDDVVTPAVNAVRNILLAASKTPTVSRVVITSSVAAAYLPSPIGSHIDRNSWNDTSVKLAREVPSADPYKPLHLYVASKVLGEKEAWNFVEKEKPHFVLNTVVPGVIFGPVVDENIVGSSSSWVKELFLGNVEPVKVLPAQPYVDVRDVAWLHLQGVLNENVKNERLFATFETVNWDIVLDILRKEFPDRKFVENFHPLSNPNTWDTKKALELFEQAGRKTIPLRKSIVDTIEGYKLV